MRYEDVKKTNRWFPAIVVLFSGIIYCLYLALQVRLPVHIAVLDASVNTLLFVIISMVLPYSANYIELKISQLLKFVLIHFLAASSINILLSVLYSIVMSAMPLGGDYNLFTTNAYLWRWTIFYFMYLVVQTINYTLLFYNSAVNSEIQEARMFTQLKEAELRSLRYQINPHFLFNSLNSIVSLISIDAQAAQNMLIKLSEFFRFSLKHEFNAIIPLKEEIEAIQHYLSIEKLRFPETLQVQIHCPPETLTEAVPALLLQPILENAIKHGVYQALSQVAINISSCIKENYLVITVENDFEPTVSPESNKSTGIGLQNVKNRLHNMYGSTELLETSKTDNTFTVKIFIPLKDYHD